MWMPDRPVPTLSGRFRLLLERISTSTWLNRGLREGNSNKFTDAEHTARCRQSHTNEVTGTRVRGREVQALT